ncbi:hypothetical protein NP233_g12404 [Leucocoprinus birnbaumii]|uniref:CBS domain-containing protein n=1 Tax=Leucocoprinus birnbaumii TaxID=56174 RepID=A0AAD5YJH0_9AGAR|nr:hypothetical protein NP233_g12404 [Leucocoprinus birnbaumii]
MLFSHHSRWLSQQSFNNSAFYSPPTEPGLKQGDSSNLAPGASFATSSDSFLGELILEPERDELINRWKGVFAKDIMETKLVIVNADMTVEEACDKLLSEGIECLVVVDSTPPTSPGLPSSDRDPAKETSNWIGLSDFSDVNAFLTLAATRHTLSPDIIKSNERLDRIVEAAKAGRVDVRLVSDFSDKNPYFSLPQDADLISVLELFARGAHRVFIENTDPQAETAVSSANIVGMISDKHLLSFFASYITSSSPLSPTPNIPSTTSTSSPPLQRFTSRALLEVSYSLLDIHRVVVAASSVATVMDAMRLMSEEGVSSVAVVDEENGMVIGGVSVTDIGRVVVPSQIYSVFPSSTLAYTIEKLLATNTRRLFVTDEAESVNPTMSPSSPGNLTGVISILEVLSLFAHLARIPDVNPRRMQRHRRASSASSHSSRSDRDLFLRTARSTSRTSIHQSPSFGTTATSGIMASPSSTAASFSQSGGSSPAGGGAMRATSPVILPAAIPDIGGALGGSVTMGYAAGVAGIPLGRKGSLSTTMRARKRDSVQ